MERSRRLMSTALSPLQIGQRFLIAGCLGLSSAVSLIYLQQSSALAQDASSVAKIAKAITVRIDGATQGSGVIVKKEGRRYTLLTAWHVVSGNRPGEEIGIYTSDGKQHRLNQGSIQRLGQVDMAVLTFNTPVSYDVASIGNIQNVSMGEQIFVSGFPLQTSAVPIRLMRFLKGDVIANAGVSIPKGYQLLYSNPTLPGMSGGSVININGELIGIHGQGETDAILTKQKGILVKTGTNQAVPISYYQKFISGKPVVALKEQAESSDDYLTQAWSLIFGEDQNLDEAIRVSTKALNLRHSPKAFLLRSIAYSKSGSIKNAYKDINNAILLENNNGYYFANRGVINAKLGRNKDALNDFNRSIDLQPINALALSNRAELHRQNQQLNKATEDIENSLTIDSSNPSALNIKGAILLDLNRPQEALRVFDKAIKFKPNFPIAYINKARAHKRLGQQKRYCLSLVLAAGQGNKQVMDHLTKPAQAWCIALTQEVLSK